MRKLVLEAKTAFGVAPKTVDRDYDEKAAKVRTIEKAIAEYSSAFSKMKSASQSLVTAMESMSKAFEAMTSGDDVPAPMKAAATDYTEVVKKAHYEFLVDYKKVYDDNESLAEVKNLAAECKRLEAKRDRVVSEYDTYRDAVKTRESKYSTKGKDLSASKHYNEEVAKRDSLKGEFESADNDFKSKFEELDAKRLSSYMEAMTAYLAGTWQMLAALEKEMAVTKATAERLYA